MLVILILIFSLGQLYFYTNVAEVRFLTDLKSKYITQDILPPRFCKDCNVLLISLDTLRAKSLPCYGYEQNTAPNLCALASKSFFFKNAYSQTAYTLDSHFSIFTSLYPLSHRMITPFVSNLSEDIVTIPQILKLENYQTLFLGVTEDHNLPLNRGLGRGFDKTVASQNPDQWIEGLKTIDLDKKFFAFLHTYAVHEPYIPQKENISRFYPGGVREYISWNDLFDKTYDRLSDLHPERFIASDGAKLKKNDTEKWFDSYQKKFSNNFDQHQEVYRAEMDNYWDTFKDIPADRKSDYIHALYATRIYELDLGMKRLFDFLRSKELLDKTIIVITADHGEEFYEHQGWLHCCKLYEEAIRVPLIIYVPGSKPQVIENLAQGIDIYPTVLNLLGVKIPNQAKGINLLSSNKNKYVISEQLIDEKQAIISRDGFKYIKSKNSDTGELYDLKNDSDEKINLFSVNPQKAKTLENQMKDVLERQKIYKQINNQPLPTWVDEEQRKKLIETGYF